MSALDSVHEILSDAGWTVATRESVAGGRSVNPTRFDLIRGKQRFQLLAYAWKITGEGLGRSGTNYRIQTTRSHTGDLLIEQGRHTVGFGVDADREVVAVFDGWTKRTKGKSSSVHIERATLDKAAAEGFAEEDPRWDGRAAARYGEIDRLLEWVVKQQQSRTAAVQPLDYIVTGEQAVVVADLWNAAPAAWLRTSDRLVLANSDGNDLLDTAIWQVQGVVVEAVMRDGPNPRHSVKFTCRRYGRVTTTNKATFLAGLTKRETA